MIGNESILRDMVKATRISVETTMGRKIKRLMTRISKPRMIKAKKTTYH